MHIQMIKVTNVIYTIVGLNMLDNYLRDFKNRTGRIPNTRCLIKIMMFL